MFKQNKFAIILTTFTLVLSLLTAGCSSTVKQVDKSSNDLVIRLEGGDWGYPSPFKHYGRGPGGFKMELIFDSLVEKDENGIIPWIAKEWKVENDGKDYIFTLNDNIKWQDGEKLTPQDVKFTFDYYKQHPPVWNRLLVNGKYIIKNVDILDSNTVKVCTDGSNATYLERIGTMRIIPKHIWETVEDPQKFESEEAVIGCGPYKFVSYNKEQGTYKLEADDCYWGPKQKVQTIEWVPVSDSVLAFEKGEVDTLGAAPDIVSRYTDNEEFKVYKNKPFWGYRLIFNMNKRSEFKDVNVRKTFACGIDRKEMVEKIARGAGVEASMGYLPVEHVWYNPQVKKYDFNIDKAKELLQNKKLSFEITIGNSSNEVKIAELMKISLEKIGINLKVKSTDMKTRDSLVKNQDFELAIIGHGGWGQDADSLRELYASISAGDNSPASGALPGYYNENVNNLAMAQMTQMNTEERKETIMKLQEIISEDVPQIPIYNTIGNFVFRPSKYDGWMYRYDHHYPEHCKLSYLERE